MFSFFKRRTFRKDTYASMSYLLGFGLNDHILNAIFATYPNIWKTIDSDFAEGKSPMDSAVGVLTIALTYEIELRVPASDYGRMERYLLHNEGEPKTVLEKGIKTYFGQLVVQKDMKGVTEFMYTFSITEIIGALKGIGREERARRRMLKSIAELIE